MDWQLGGARTDRPVLFPRITDCKYFFGLNEATTQLTADFIRYLSIFNVAFSVNMILGQRYAPLGTPGPRCGLVRL